MKKMLLLAVALFAVSTMTAHSDFEPVQNLEYHNFGADFQSRQAVFDSEYMQAYGKIRKNCRIAKIGEEQDVRLTPEQSAFYYNPSGTFFFGSSKQGRLMKKTYLIAPTYTELVWPNATGSWANTFEWEYVDQVNSTNDNLAVLLSSDRDLKTSGVGLTIFPTPLLTATGSGIRSSYGLGGAVGNSNIELNGNVIYGGSVSSLVNHGMLQTNFGASVYDVSKLDQRFYVMNDEGTEFLAGKDAVSESLKVRGFLNAIDKPASPYFIDADGIWAFARVSAADNAEFRCTLYKISFVEVTMDDGTKQVLPKMGEEICHSTQTFGQLKQNMRELTPNVFTGAMAFNNFVLEDDFGYEYDVVPIIDTAIAVVISGFESDDVYSFELATNTQPFDEFNRPDIVANSRLITHYFVLSESFDPTLKIAAPYLMENFSLSIMMDACFPWLHADETAFESPVAGGSKTFKVSCYFPPRWKFIVNDDMANIKNMDPQSMNIPVQLTDWLSAKVDRGPRLTFTTSALEPGQPTRTAKVTVVDVLGLEQSFWIAQHDPAGVDELEGQVNVVKAQNGSLIVSSATANLVEVFNLAGQKVASSQFDGECVIDAHHWAKGMYIVKFDDNSVVKILI